MVPQPQIRCVLYGKKIERTVKKKKKNVEDAKCESRSRFLGEDDEVVDIKAFYISY